MEDNESNEPVEPIVSESVEKELPVDNAGAQDPVTAAPETEVEAELSTEHDPVNESGQPLAESPTDDEPEVFEPEQYEAPKITKHVDPRRNIERLMDVEMNVTVRFGKTEVPLREAVHFGIGSMIELNRSVDEPVDLLVNNFPFARGEVVVIDGYYGVKITEIGTPEERSETLLTNANN